MTNARVLAGRLADLLRTEQNSMAGFLVALADFDRRRAWVELGHKSLFYFLHRELGLSTGASCYRKTAAHLVQKFPEIVEPLRDGRFCRFHNQLEARQMFGDAVMDRYTRNPRQGAGQLALSPGPSEGPVTAIPPSAVLVPGPRSGAVEGAPGSSG
jgi:hypothetical protein